MTKEELNQLSDLRMEIRELRAKIDNLSQKGSRIVSDKVKASSKDFPYTEVSVKIQGYDVVMDQRTRRQIMEKKILLNKRLQQAEELELRISKYINSVTESRIRRMMEYKYIEGRTWEQIGQILHCDRTTAEKAVSGYLLDHPEEP